MKKEWIGYIGIGILVCAALMCGILYTKAAWLQHDISEKVLRFHVLANSDSEEDQKLKLEVKVSDEEMAARKAKWQPREPKITTGYLARYAAMVTSGNRGAILEVPKAK